MKKLLIIFVAIFLFGTFSANAMYHPMKTGNFNGKIFSKSEVIGEISGTYTFIPIVKDGFAINRYKGLWEIKVGEYAGTTGTVICIGGRIFQIGRITIDDIDEKFSIFSQISFNEINKRFSGDLKIILGPTLYTTGDYQ